MQFALASYRVCVSLILVGCTLLFLSMTNRVMAEDPRHEPEDVLTEGMIASLHIIPPQLVVTDRYPAQWGAFARLKDGSWIDVTHAKELHVTIAPEGATEVASVKGDLIMASATGQATLHVDYFEHTASASIHSEKDSEIAFDREILSTLTRSGCNLGTCHGNLFGKGGFRLSLRGDDPDFDHYRIAREFGQRRLDLWNAAESLLLKKGTAQIAHQGGKRLDVESPQYQSLVDWIASGAPPSHASPLVRLEIVPSLQRLGSGTRQTRIVVIAKFANGQSRDVTRWSRLESNAVSGIVIGGDGTISVEHPMDVSLSASYLSGRAGARILFPGTVLPSSRENGDANASSVRSPSSSTNPIDVLVDQQCQTLRLALQPRTDDATLIRRLYLVAAGRLPTPEETQSFLDSTAPNKYEVRVDELLASPGFDYVWAMRWSDLIRNEDKVMSPKGARRLHDWLREQVAADRSLSEWTAQLLSSVGSTYENPPASYQRTHRDPFVTAESAAQVFLGVRVQCAKCHNHPFDVWKQDDYYGLASFFSTVERKQIDNKPKDELDKHIITGDEIISLAERSPEIKHPGRSQMVPPRPLTGMGNATYVSKPSGTQTLEQFAQWVSRENPQFDANMANRIWYQYFGRGIVEPPDDFRDSNPPSNPELLDFLAEHLRSRGYSLKELSRTILTSETFARQSVSDIEDLQQLSPIPYFAGYPIRRLPAEVLLDAISDACDAPTVLKPASDDNDAAVLRAMQMPGIPKKKGFLTTFGKPDRLLVCECERSNQVSLGQSLALVNGVEVREKLTAADNRIGRLLRAERPFEEMVSDLFMSALCRQPTSEEQAATRALLEQSQDRPKDFGQALLAVQQQSTPSTYRMRRVLEDVLWALINSKEFTMLR